jgi:hypothetical protein
MRKKILPVFLAIIILFGSTVMQVKRAEAAAWMGILPVAYAGAAAYVLGAVAVGSIALGLGLEYGDEINHHASEVWKKTNQLVKDSWKVTLDLANTSGNYIIELNEDIKTTYNNARNVLVGTIVTSAIKKLAEKNTPAKTDMIYTDVLGNSQTTQTSYPDVNRIRQSDPYGADRSTLILGAATVFAITDTSGQVYFFRQAEFKSFADGTVLMDGKAAVDRFNNPIGTTLSNVFNSRIGTNKAQSIFFADYMISSVEKLLDVFNLYRNTATKFSDLAVIPVSEMQNFYDKYTTAKADAAAKVTTSIPMATPNAKSGISTPTINTSTGAVTIPTSVPLTPEGTILKNPDGTTYTGDVTWTFPVPTVGTVAGTPTMTVPISGVGVVELDTGLAIPTTPPPPTGGSDPGRIDWSKLKMTAATLTTVFPFSIPWDVGKLFSVLNVPPKTPVFNIDTGTTIKLGNKNIPVNFKFDINFSFLDSIAAIVRWGFILIFDIAIIMALRRLTPD